MIRTKFYELLTKGISPDQIFVILTKALLKDVPDNLKTEIIKYAVLFDSRCKAGAKAIMHLEAFTARVMCLFKTYSMRN
jgi:replication factor C subunit 3/5